MFKVQSLRSSSKAELLKSRVWGLGSLNPMPEAETQSCKPPNPRDWRSGSDVEA